MSLLRWLFGPSPFELRAELQSEIIRVIGEREASRASEKALAEALGKVSCPASRQSEWGGTYDVQGCVQFVAEPAATSCEACRTLAAYRKRQG